jgi:hypothetical protein
VGLIYYIYKQRNGQERSGKERNGWDRSGLDWKPHLKRWGLFVIFINRGVEGLGVDWIGTYRKGEERSG